MSQPPLFGRKVHIHEKEKDTTATYQATVDWSPSLRTFNINLQLPTISAEVYHQFGDQPAALETYTNTVGRSGLTNQKSETAHDSWSDVNRSRLFPPGFGVVHYRSRPGCLFDYSRGLFSTVDTASPRRAISINHQPRGLPGPRRDAPFLTNHSISNNSTLQDHWPAVCTVDVHNLVGYRGDVLGRPSVALHLSLFMHGVDTAGQHVSHNPGMERSGVKGICLPQSIINCMLGYTSISH